MVPEDNKKGTCCKPRVLAQRPNRASSLPPVHHHLPCHTPARHSRLTRRLLLPRCLAGTYILQDNSMEEGKKQVHVHVGLWSQYQGAYIYEVSTPKHVEYLMDCISAQLDNELFSEKLGATFLLISAASSTRS